jgi:hypothetical protein
MIRSGTRIGGPPADDVVSRRLSESSVVQGIVRPLTAIVLPSVCSVRSEMDYTALLSVLAPIAGVIAAVVAGTYAARAKTTEHSLALRRDEFQAQLLEQRTHDEYMRDVVRLAQEPLLYAASDLQSRIYHIINGSLVEANANSDKERHRTNVTEYTVFLFAQYFGWAEAIRQGVMLRSMAGDSQSSADDVRSVSSSIRKVNDTLRNDAPGRDFILFAGEQHAIGELMFQWDSTTGRRLPAVLRYASFAKRYRADPEFHRWFEGIVEGMTVVGNADVVARLSVVQNHLVDLMELLDPEHRVYKTRSRLAVVDHKA